MQDNAPDTDRWMTYDELAAQRGISVASATRLVRRRRWRRQTDNAGAVRVLVPVADTATPERLSDVIRMLGGIEDLMRGYLSADVVGVADRWADAVRQLEAAKADNIRLREELEALRGREYTREEMREACKNNYEMGLRQAEAERKGQGRWQRIKMAWRG